MSSVFMSMAPAPGSRARSRYAGYRFNWLSYETSCGVPSPGRGACAVCVYGRTAWYRRPGAASVPVGEDEAQLAGLVVRVALDLLLRDLVLLVDGGRGAERDLAPEG